MNRALAGAALLLAAACGSGTLESRDIASLAGIADANATGAASTTDVANADDAAAPSAPVTPPRPVRLHGHNLATLPGKRAGVPRVLFLGDSIAAGFGLPRKAEPYPGLLAQRLAEEGVAIEVLNGGVFGFTTFGGLALSGMSSLHPDIVVIELGGNDFLLGGSLDAARDNLATMVRNGRDMGAQVLLVGVKLPPFLRETRRGQRFDVLYTELAHELDVPLVPDMFEDALGNPRFMQHDMIHPTAEGQKVVADNLLPGLRPLVLAVLGR